MSDNRPPISIEAVNKDSKDRHKIAAAWVNDRPGFSGSYNVRLSQDVKAIVLADGTKLTNDGFFFNLKDWRVPREDAPPADFDDEPNF